MNSLLKIFFSTIFVFSFGYSYSQISVVSNLSNTFYNQGSDPEDFIEYNGWVYFSAFSDITGIELWRSDGTPNGTTLFADIGNFKTSGEPRQFVIFQSYLYFIANNHIDGQEIWRTDGTIGGTEMFTNFTIGSPGSLCVLNNSLIFHKSDGVLGNQIWISDGTESGTQLLKDINPNTTTSYASSEFYSNGNNAFFMTDDGIHGNELWKTDGTATGTTLVKDINLGINPSYSFLYPTMTICNGLLLFCATNGSDGSELWSSDGTEAGTIMVSDLFPGAQNSNPQHFTTSGNNVFFIATENTNTDKIWISDGSSIGTHPISIINSETQPPNLYVAGGNVYFSHYNTTSGMELWKTNSDGSGGTVLVKDISPGISGSYPASFCLFGENTYFRAGGGGNGFELWRTDGTENGTTLVKDIIQGFFGSTPRNLAVCNDLLFFTAATNAVVNFEPWVSDGTINGTINLGEVCYSSSGEGYVASDKSYKIYNNNLYFSEYGQGSNPSGMELYRSGGTSASTGLFIDLVSGATGSYPKNFIEINDHLFYNINVDNSVNSSIVRTDGTTANTTTLVNSNSGALGEANNQLVFFMNGSFYPSIYTCDVNSNPVHLLNLNGCDLDNSFAMCTVNDLLFFSIHHNFYGTELWRTDGTIAGTFRVKDINSGAAGSFPQNFAEHNGLLYFSADDGLSGRELWVSDGTESGTSLVKDIIPGLDSGKPKNIVSFEDKIYFSAFTPEYGQEMWESDGSTIGTNLSYDLEPGVGSSNPLDLTAGLDGIYFTARTPTLGRELWIKKNNVPAELVVDLITGVSSSNPSSLKLINNILYFAGNDGLHGYEPYSTLGSDCSTYMIQDLNPGDRGSFPIFCGEVNGKLLLGATNQATGWEIFGSNIIHANVDSVLACQEYYWPVINDTLETSGLYSHIFQDVSGCDSIVNLSLIIGDPSTTVDHITSCSSYTWIDGIEYTTSNSSATHTLTSITGCDSTVSLNLTINYPSTTSSTEDITSCSNYYWQAVDTLLTESGSYNATIPNSSGCDSLITLNLTINNPSMNMIDTATCSSFYWDIAQTTLTDPGTYTWTLTNSAGCDSTVTLNLYILLNEDLQISVDTQGTLTMLNGTVTSWINCSDNTTIVGETGNVFTPAESGSYAAVGYENVSNCPDTSNCIYIDFLQIGVKDQQNFQLYPNPTNDIITISFDGNEAELMIYDAHGKLIQKHSSIHSGELVSLANVQNGVYFFEISTSEGKEVKRVVKN